MSIWIRPEDWQLNGHVHVNLEVINPATWQYISLRHVDLISKYPNYRNFTTDPWVGRPTTVSVLGYTDPYGHTDSIDVNVDDLYVNCNR
ncbi:hypothetical protein ABT297_17105 [Dactylosporangium sp. NPDC000555]|uniref:hypothetical protein n=1 Tax=Dactylosporangium sp. NPDC000555 TaxID=3154260 RepID=UPI0033288D1E